MLGGAAMKKTLRIALILAVPALLALPSLLAQQAPPPPNKPEEPRTAQEKPQAQEQQARSQAQAAPKLGHPLDPADVDILTGKTKSSAAPSYGGYAPAPYPYLSYPVNVAEYSPSRSLGWNSLASPPFVPLAFGRFNGQNFFVIGNTTSFGPPLFFFGRGRTGFNSFFFAPARPGFIFRR